MYDLNDSRYGVLIIPLNLVILNYPLWGFTLLIRSVGKLSHKDPGSVIHPKCTLRSAP